MGHVPSPFSFPPPSLPFPPLFYPSLLLSHPFLLPFPPLLFSSPPFSLIQLEGLGRHCKLPQRGLGWSFGCQCTLTILTLENMCSDNRFGNPACNISLIRTINCPMPVSAYKILCLLGDQVPLTDRMGVMAWLAPGSATDVQYKMLSVNFVLASS